MDHLREIRELHAAKIEPFIGKPVGCDDAEITGLERRLGFKLPLAYVQYLWWMGRDTRGMFVGSDCFIQDVEQNTQDLPRLLADNGVAFDLPAHYLAWFSHQGYQMVWFALPPDSDDPMCWWFCEGVTTEPRSVGRFTAWLRPVFEDTAEWLPENQWVWDRDGTSERPE